MSPCFTKLYWGASLIFKRLITEHNGNPKTCQPLGKVAINHRWQLIQLHLLRESHCSDGRISVGGHVIVLYQIKDMKPKRNGARNSLLFCPKRPVLLNNVGVWLWQQQIHFWTELNGTKWKPGHRLCSTVKQARKVEIYRLDNHVPCLFYLFLSGLDFTEISSNFLKCAPALFKNPGN